MRLRACCCQWTCIVAAAYSRWKQAMQASPQRTCRHARSLAPYLHNVWIAGGVGEVEPTQQFCQPGMWSRSRRLGLTTVSRRTNVSSRSRLEKILNVSVSTRTDASQVSSQSLSNMSRSRPSRSHLGSRAIASRRNVLCRSEPCLWTLVQPLTPSIMSPWSTVFVPVSASLVLYSPGSSLICQTEPSQCALAITPQLQPGVPPVFPRVPSLGHCYLRHILHRLQLLLALSRFVISNMLMTLSSSSR